MLCYVICQLEFLQFFVSDRPRLIAILRIRFQEVLCKFWLGTSLYTGQVLESGLVTGI